MTKRLHIPNLFLIVGQPDNGKTTISNWFQRMLHCEVIHTDQLYHAWIAKNYPKQSKAAKHDIRNHYPRMTREWQREWTEYAVGYILDAVKRAKLDLVVEGWLMLFIPDDLRKKLTQYATVMSIHMKHYTAYAAQKSIRSNGRDYTDAVKGLCDLMAKSKGIHFMRNNVHYQSFEDIRDFQGTSDSAGKLLAIHLPQDLTGRKVLDVGCSTGYFTIRAWQRGARAYGIDKRRRHVTTATRLASTVYRTTEPRFYVCDFYKWAKSTRFDYILAVNLMSRLDGSLADFFDRAYDLLIPGGTLIVEMAVSCVHGSHPHHDEPHIETKDINGMTFSYPNEHTLEQLTKKFKLTYRGRSLRMHGDKRRRVYHFQKPISDTSVPIAHKPEPTLFYSI